MPHLDVASYVTQYEWALFVLLLLFFFLLIGILPILQQQLVLRDWAEERLKNKRSDNLIKEVGSIFLLRGLLSEKC